MEFEKLKAIIAREISSVKEEDIKPESRFIDDLGMDSLDVAQIVLSIEDEFGIEVPDDAIEHLETVQQAVDAIKQAVEAKN
ncbi:MAG: acyl carrier protein [Oribacterium sp.]|jgi:acyl carrier protein|nr:acyl carrier protein [Oribacterium sp.]MDY6317560.1 acyl carrier protein [Oribacterium sp.]